MDPVQPFIHVVTSDLTINSCAIYRSILLQLEIVLFCAICRVIRKVKYFFGDNSQSEFYRQMCPENEEPAVRSNPCVVTATGSSVELSFSRKYCRLFVNKFMFVFKYPDAYSEITDFQIQPGYLFLDGRYDCTHTVSAFTRQAFSNARPYQNINYGLDYQVFFVHFLLLTANKEEHFLLLFVGREMHRK